MKIDPELLLSYGAVIKEYKKNEVIFCENEMANFYFQIIKGCVKMYNSNDEGKEFTQGYFSNGRSFGEPSLIVNEKYLSNAIALNDCNIIKLSKDKFLKILEEYPCLQKNLLNLMCHRILSKSKTSNDIINQKPEFRVTAFLNDYKKKTNSLKKETIPFTRQEIANFTGLRVETVIRVITKMDKHKKVDVINHKIFY